MAQYGTIVLALGFGCSAAAVPYPVPSALPPHSWDSVAHKVSCCCDFAVCMSANARSDRRAHARTSLLERYTHTRTHARSLTHTHARTHSHARTHTHARTRTRTRTHTHTHKHTHTHSPAHTHTHTLAHSLKVFIHGCKAQGLFNASELALAAKFPLMTVEKGQGYLLPGFADGKMAAIAAQWKAARRAQGLPDGWALFYQNAHYDWQFFQLHEQMKTHPTWACQANGAVSGHPCHQRGDGEFPQPPNGMLLFNFSNEDTRAAFINACVNATKHGFDGCFIDSALSGVAAKFCNVTDAASNGVQAGKYQMMTELQEAVGSGRLIAAKDSFGGGSEQQVNTIFPKDTFCSCYSCATYEHGDAEHCQTQILEAIKLGQRGQVALLHGEVNAANLNPPNPAALTADFTFSLAAFLVASSDTSFFGYSYMWYFNGTTWHDEYVQPITPLLFNGIYCSRANIISLL